MAAKPQMTVRLAPSIEHALHFLAERDGISPAELARLIITAGCQTALDKHNLRAQCQDAYMLWLTQKGPAALVIDEGDEDLGDDHFPTRAGAHATEHHVESGALYGAPATVPALGGSSQLWNDPPIQAQERRLDELFGKRADGRKRRS